MVATASPPSAGAPPVSVTPPLAPMASTVIRQTPVGTVNVCTAPVKSKVVVSAPAVDGRANSSAPPNRAPAKVAPTKRRMAVLPLAGRAPDGPAQPSRPRVIRAGLTTAGY